MKFTWTHMTIYLLCLLLLAGGLTGCSSDDEEDGTAGAAEEADVEDEDTPEEDGAQTGANSTSIIKVNGEEIDDDEFVYWVCYYITALASAYEIEDWSQEMADGLTYADYVMQEAADTIVTYRTIELWAEELDVELDDEDRQEIQDAMDYDLEYYGDEETLKEYMDLNHMTEELYAYIYTQNMLYTVLYEAVNGEAGDAYTDGEILDYAEGAGMMQAKQIMLLTTDDEGEPLEEDALAEKTALLEDLLDQLEASDDPTALFDELIDAYSEDADQAYLPDGYLFSPGDMLTEFETACAELEENAWSGIVESEYGYHIVLRLPVDPEAVPVSAFSAGYDYTLRQIVAEELFQEELSGRKADMTVIYTLYYDTFDLADYV